MRARRIFCLLAGLWLTGALLDHSTALAQAPLPTPPATISTAGGAVTVLADRLEERAPDQLVVATGNVEITRGSTRLTADRVELNRETGEAVATGRAMLYDGDDRLTGERIDYNVKTGTGVVSQGSAHAAPYYRIGGERMERLAEGRYLVHQGIFTTCEADPPAWSFHFGTADADFEELLSGTNGSFWVRNIPLIPFIPFFAAPIRRERQTGFLFPRFGTTTRKGRFVELPFYWVIAENMDATVTFDAYEKRGFGGDVEFRYLLSRTHQGSVNGFFISESERAIPTTETGQEVDLGHGKNRGWWVVKHDWLMTPGVTFRADLTGVSDDLVFRDYGDLLSQRGAQRAESNVFLTTALGPGNLVSRLFWYQDLTTKAAVELQRLPEVRYDIARKPLPGEQGFLYDLESSAVNFVREVGSSGGRLDLHPRLSRPLPVFGFFTVTPFIGGRLTGYDKTVRTIEVDRHGVSVERTTDDPQVRRLVEVGSDFEARAARVFSVNGVGGVDAVLHTIEPRVNYTLREGSDLVRFLKRGATPRPSRLPQWDGVDAVAESSAVTYSLIQRLRARTVAPEGTEPTRWELARWTIGHSYEMRKEDRPLGNITTDLLIDPSRYLTFRADAAYNVYGEGLKTLNTDVAVTVPRLLASVGTRLTREPVVTDPNAHPKNRVATNFLQGNVKADVTSNLTARFQTNWDVKSDVFIENRVGVDLKWQCWAFSVDFVSRNRNEDEIRFTLNILGLGTPLTTGTALTRASAGTGTTSGGIR